MSYSYLRDSHNPPRLNHLLNRYPGNIRAGHLEAFLFLIWNSLQAHLADPIQITEKEGQRTVTFMGAVRFITYEHYPSVVVQELKYTNGTLGFVDSGEKVAIDLPCRLDGFWLDAYLEAWKTNLSECLIDHYRPGPGDWYQTVRQELVRALRRSTNWRRLRHTLRDTLALDRQLLNWLRHGRHLSTQRYITNGEYQKGKANRHHYIQLAREQPNLLWLITMALELNLSVPAGDATSALKKMLLKEPKIGPVAWRYLLKCKRQHFANVTDRYGPDGELSGRWIELVMWLRVVTTLKLTEPVSPEVAQIFMHDSLVVNDDGTLEFRYITLKPAIVRAIVSEAERRLVNGSLASFIDEDLVEVLGWLQCDEPELDSNQLKQGWKYLAKAAVQWKVEAEAEGTLKEFTWSSLLPSMVIGACTVVPITDAWQLRQEALAMCHCVDNYLLACMTEQKRLFSVRDAKGQRVATVGLELVRGAWQTLGFRGFANREVNANLVGLDDEVLSRFIDVWRLTHDAPPESAKTEYWRKMNAGRGQAQAEENEEEEDDIEAEEDSVDSACPICNSTDHDCGHAVAIYDVTFGELEGGALYDVYDDIHRAVEAGIRHAITTGEWRFEASDDVRGILGQISDVATAEEIDRIIGQHYGEIRAMIFDRLENCASGVTVTDWVFDANRPGGCSAYLGYWAEDPEKVVKFLRVEFRVAIYSDYQAGKSPH